MLQSAVSSNSYEIYKKYAQGIYDLPIINLRDLIRFRERNLKKSIDIKEVETICKYSKKVW